MIWLSGCGTIELLRRNFRTTIALTSIIAYGTASTKQHCRIIGDAIGPHGRTKVSLTITFGASSEA